MSLLAREGMGPSGASERETACVREWACWGGCFRVADETGRRRGVDSQSGEDADTVTRTLTP